MGMENKKVSKNIGGLVQFFSGLLAIFFIYSLMEYKGISLLYPILIFFTFGVAVGTISFRFRLEMDMALTSEEKKEWEGLYFFTSLSFAFSMIGFIVLAIVAIINI